MEYIIDETHDYIKKLILESLKKITNVDDDLVSVEIAVPPSNEYGDFSTNAAFVFSRILKKHPFDMATFIVNHFPEDLLFFSKVKVESNGFINFYLSNHWYKSVIESVVRLKEDYGKSNFGNKRKVLVEFISANPTGPMHIGNARGGALGDVLSSILAEVGFCVEREFYLNDFGNQIEKFVQSLKVRIFQLLKHKSTLFRSQSI